MRPQHETIADRIINTDFHFGIGPALESDATVVVTSSLSTVSGAGVVRYSTSLRSGMESSRRCQEGEEATERGSWRRSDTPRQRHSSNRLVASWATRPNSRAECWDIS